MLCYFKTKFIILWITRTIFCFKKISPITSSSPANPRLPKQPRTSVLGARATHVTAYVCATFTVYTATSTLDSVATYNTGEHKW